MDDAGIPGKAHAPPHRRRGSLHTEATVRLREMIMSGELAPGTRLREVALCGQFGVSRTPVREALRTLAAEGLVRLLPNRSVMVSGIEAKELGELVPVFASIEALAARTACSRITDGEIVEIGGLLAQMIDFHASRDRREYLRINQTIHRRTVEISGNSVLIGIWLQLVPRMERARAIPNLDMDRWTGALIEHTKMYTALAARNGDLLAALTEQHFMNGLPHLLRTG
jgi:DNA-binding GntR family transcriptional regulator